MRLTQKCNCSPVQFGQAFMRFKQSGGIRDELLSAAWLGDPRSHRIESRRQVIELRRRDDYLRPNRATFTASLELGGSSVVVEIPADGAGVFTPVWINFRAYLAQQGFVYRSRKVPTNAESRA